MKSKFWSKKMLILRVIIFVLDDSLQHNTTELSELITNNKAVTSIHPFLLFNLLFIFSLILFLLG